MPRERPDQQLLDDLNEIDRVGPGIQAEVDKSVLMAVTANTPSDEPGDHESRAAGRRT